ncbi:MAG: hypothetical protein JXO72_05875, partial [Vicinamibacteria bacterium]|nr:hypothetical protein [Vicinamibacteria bacterium]
MMMRERKLPRSFLRRIPIGACPLFTMLLHACSSPTAPPPVEVHSLQAVVFYDENGDGRMGPEERVRVPQVILSCSGNTG